MQGNCRLARCQGPGVAPPPLGMTHAGAWPQSGGYRGHGRLRAHHHQHVTMRPWNPTARVTVQVAPQRNLQRGYTASSDRYPRPR